MGTFPKQPTNPEPTPQPPPLLRVLSVSILHTQYTSYLPSSLSGVGTWQLGKGPVPGNPLRLFSLTNPKPMHAASPVPPCQNHNKGSCPHCPQLPLPPDPHWWFPVWSLVRQSIPPPPGNIEEQTIFSMAVIYSNH